MDTRQLVHDTVTRQLVHGMDIMKMMTEALADPAMPVQPDPAMLARLDLAMLARLDPATPVRLDPAVIVTKRMMNTGDIAKVPFSLIGMTVLRDPIDLCMKMKMKETDIPEAPQDRTAASLTKMTREEAGFAEHAQMMMIWPAAVEPVLLIPSGPRLTLGVHHELMWQMFPPKNTTQLGL